MLLLFALPSLRLDNQPLNDMLIYLWAGVYLTPTAQLPLSYMKRRFGATTQSLGMKTLMWSVEKEVLILEGAPVESVKERFILVMYAIVKEWECVWQQ